MFRRSVAELIRRPLDLRARSILRCRARQLLPLAFPGKVKAVMFRRRLYLAGTTAAAAVLCSASLAAQAPAAQAPRRQAPAATSGRSVTMNVTVTDGTGAPIDGVEVSATGPVTREGTTADGGALRLLGIRPGNYRLRFERDGYLTLERDLAVRAGQAATVDVTLSNAVPAPEPPAPDAPPEAKTAEVPPGEPAAVSIADFVERNFISSRDPRREDELGCTASARTRLLQLREDTAEEARSDADEVLYVVAGEGTLRLGNKDVPLKSSVTAIVPRGTVRAIARKGRNPLIVLSVVSGPPCTK
jgi:mannose-6-phosphate isomerase-like protein (cupin superfamily)